MGRLALARLQQRLPTGKPLVKLARDAGENLREAIKLAQDALEVNAAVEAAVAKAGENAPSRAGRSSTATFDEMNSRIGWARAELAKVCLAEASPEYVSRVGHPTKYKSSSAGLKAGWCPVITHRKRPPPGFVQPCLCASHSRLYMKREPPPPLKTLT